MGNFIKYKRISKILRPDDLEKIFDDLIKEDFEVIYYNERILDKSENHESFHATIVCGKKNNGIKNKKIL